MKHKGLRQRVAQSSGESDNRIDLGATTSRPRESKSMASKVVQHLRDMYGVDLRGLAVWRMMVALIVLYDVYRRTGIANNWLEMRAWYSEQGVFPRALAARRMSPEACVMFLCTASMFGQGVLFLVTAFAAGCLLVGYKTRISTIIVWLMFMGYQRRNPLIHQSGDTVMRHSLFWMIWFSLDQRHGISPEIRGPNRILTLPGAGILLQCGALYLFACCHKSYTGYVQDATVINDILQFEHYVSSNAGFLAEYLLTNPVLSKLLCVSTFYTELICGIFMLLPFLYPQGTRLTAILATSGLQVGFMLCLNLGIFPVSSLSLAIPGLPSSLWDALFPHTVTTISPASEQVAQLSNKRSGDGSEKQSTLSKMCRWSGNGRKLKIWAIEGVGAMLIVVMFASNVQYLRKDGDLFVKNTYGFKMPSSWMPLHNFLGLKQIWNMFAFKANEPSITGRMIIGGHLEDGKQLDLQTGRFWNNLSTSRWSHNMETTRVFPHFHWRAYALYVFSEEDVLLWSSMMRFMCNKYNVWEKSGMRYHNTPSNVLDSADLELIEVWRITYHVNRSLYKSHSSVPLEQFESEHRIFAWNCLKNRQYREDEDS